MTVEDIEEGRAPRPKVLDMFAGGGAIPLEALRLGCEAYALDLNPVAHIIQLCTLVYPQKYGKPDPNVRGMTGRPQAGSLSHQTTWGGLANEVRYWGEWVLKKVKAEIGDLYPLIPDPEYRKTAEEKNGGTGFQPVQQDLFKTRRNLPHWQMGGSIYFVTFRTKGIELAPEARTIVLNSCRHFDGKRYSLWSAVVMPDHVHLLLQPTEIEKDKWHSLSSILHSIKSFTANKINAFMGRTGSVWQDESFDRIVRDENEFLEKRNYIRNNPVKRELVQSPDEWIGYYECTGRTTGRMPVLPDSSLKSIPPGYLVPVAYLWTRTVRCKNPSCGATVPLAKQTWLCKKKGRFVALKMVTAKDEKKVRFEVVESSTEKGLGFDPASGSEGGNATCPFCGTVADAEYVQTVGKTNSVGMDLMAVVCVHPKMRGKKYIALSDLPLDLLPGGDFIQGRIDELCRETGLTQPHEPISHVRPSPNARGLSAVTRHGIATFKDLFSDRQLLGLLTFCKALINAPWKSETDSAHSKAILTYLAGLIDKISDYGCTFCQWLKETEAVAHTFARHALAMKWDFAELCPFGLTGSNAQSILNSQIDALKNH